MELSGIIKRIIDSIYCAHKNTIRYVPSMNFPLYKCEDYNVNCQGTIISERYGLYGEPLKDSHKCVYHRALRFICAASETLMIYNRDIDIDKVFEDLRKPPL